jgi:TolB protein
VGRFVPLLGVAAIVATVASAATVTPRGRIAFASASGAHGDTQIWVMRADGRGRRALTAVNQFNQSPALSPNGKQIAFETVTGTEHDLYVRDVNGTVSTLLVPDAASPAWAPDGKRIAFASSADLWVIRSDGTHKRRLTRTAALEDTPTWSPDGKRLAYARDGRIWVVTLGGRRQRPLTKTTDGVDWAPAWSPDGKRIVYQSNRQTNPADPTNEIWLINADGSHPVRLTNNAINDYQPVWSPDGLWLAFASDRPKGVKSHIWLMRPSGLGAHRVSTWQGEEYHPSWGRG